MHRAVTIAVVVTLAIAGCSSGDDGDGSTAAAESDPVVAFCAGWDRFDRLTNADDEAPTEALVQEVVDLQDAMGKVVPDELDPAWASILDWNTPFIQWFETAGYQEPTDDVVFELLGGEDAAIAASQARSGAYETIRTWSRANCPAGDDATFCELWPSYDDFLESDPEPTEELIARLLEMQEEIDDVLPPELGDAWSGIVDWNQAFIDVFERIGYGPVTEETFLLAFDDDEEAAGAAGEALEAGLATIRSWTGSNCTDDSEFASSFCEHWDEFAFLTADEDAMTRDSYDEAIALIDRVGDEVPAEIRGDWDAVVESARGFHDVLVSVNFQPDHITDELLEQAFGSIESAVATEEAADAGRAAIEEWALSGCGDFCSRWPELRRALDETAGELWWVRDEGEGEGRGQERLAEHLRAFEIGSQLVPGEIREPWDLAVAARRDWFAWWESFEYDGERFESPEVTERALEIMRGATYLVAENDFIHVDSPLLGRFGGDVRPVLAAWQEGVDQAPEWLWTTDFPEHEKHEIAAWLEGTGEAPGWINESLRWGPGGWFDGQPTAAIDGWVSENCEAITGQPGTVKVLWPKIEGAAGDTLVVAVMERGATFEDLADPSLVLAGTCAEIQSDPWGVWRDEHGREERWESEEFRAERWEEGALCDYNEQQAVRLDAGTYTMLAAVVEGRPGRHATGTASACSAFDVRIDGDTVVDVPTLPACDVDLGGSDDPWRNPPPVDPATQGAGTLHVVFPDLVAEERGGELIVVVLPAGTTLNDVGREQVWPAGATRTWLIDEGTIEEGQTVGEVVVPVAELPATGSARALEPLWLAEGQPANRLPLAVLAPGTYDVHVQIRIHDPPEQEHSDRAKNDRCGTFEVTIAGDTVVDLPELGECPRVV